MSFPHDVIVPYNQNTPFVIHVEISLSPSRSLGRTFLFFRAICLSKSFPFVFSALECPGWQISPAHFLMISFQRCQGQSRMARDTQVSFVAVQNGRFELVDPVQKIRR